MNTVIVNYKDVFKLAESKGYNGFSKMTYTKGTSEIYIELCLIQKWLRDTHKIFIEVIRMNVYDKYFSLRVKTDEKTELMESFDTYEESMLHGINEALQLI